MELITLIYNPIAVESILAHLRCPEAGAVVLFHGTARNRSAESKVLRLRYEAYEEMALQEMKGFALEALKRWGLHRVALVHRLGEVPVGEDAVIVGVSASHRAEGFEACRFLIDSLKASAPIWKEEVLEEGSRWVGNPSTAAGGATPR